MNVKAKQILHECKKADDAICDMYGSAVGTIEFYDNRWWMHNGEYATSCEFCPFCGVKLEKPNK